MKSNELGQAGNAKKTLQILKKFRNYYDANRGVGHTSAVLGSAFISDALLIAGTPPLRDYLRRKYLGPVLCLDCPEEALIGRRNPLVFDNQALAVLFSMAIEAIEDSKGETRRRGKIKCFGMKFGWVEFLDGICGFFGKKDAKE